MKQIKISAGILQRFFFFFIGFYHPPDKDERTQCQSSPWREAAALVQVAVEFSRRGQQETEIRRRGFDGPWGEFWMVLHSDEVTMIWNNNNGLIDLHAASFNSMWIGVFNVAFHSPSSSMTSILSPSTSWPTKWRPCFSKWCFSSGFTWNEQTFNDGVSVVENAGFMGISFRHKDVEIKKKPWSYLKSVSVPLVNKVDVSVQFSCNDNTKNTRHQRSRVRH